jgi:hypothetical protein
MSKSKWAKEKVDPDEYRKDHEEASRRSETFKFPEGTTMIRLVLGAGGSKPYQKYAAHYVPRPSSNGKDDESKAAVLCKHFYNGENCPVCEYVEMLTDSGSKKNQAFADDIRLSIRYLFQGIVRKKDNISGIVRFNMSNRAYTSLLGILNDSEYGVITDPYEGRDIKVIRKGMDRSTEYTFNPRLKVTPLVSNDEGEPDEEAIDELMEARILWDDTLKFMPDSKIYELIPEFKALKKGKKVVEDDSEEEEVKTKSKKSKKLIEDDDDEEDDEVPKKSAKSSKQSSKKSVEDEEEEDDEEDDTPKKSKKGKKSFKDLE